MSAQRLQEAARVVRNRTDDYPPGVALALADWLDAEALVCSEPIDRTRAAALHAADLILGDPAMIPVALLIASMFALATLIALADGEEL